MHDTLEKIRGDFEKAKGQAILHDEPLRAYLARYAPVLGNRILERLRDYRELYESTPAGDFKQRQELEHHLGRIDALEREVEAFVAEGDDGISSVAASEHVAIVEARDTTKAGRKSISSDVDCRNIYDLKYRLGWSYKDIIAKYWPGPNLPENTANDRVKQAINRGRKLTPSGQRPEADPNRS